MINLLPDKFKYFFKQEAFYKTIIVWQLVGLLIMIFGVIGLIYINFLQASEINFQKSILATIEGETNEINKSQESIRNLNKKVIAVSKIFSEKSYQEDIINEIASYVPSSISINSLAINKETQNPSVIVRGFSKDSDSIYAFKKNLESSKRVKKISFPLGDLIKDKDIDFTVSFEFLKVTETHE